MKQILFLSTVLMITAGIFGLADMTNDVYSGNMIDYEKQEAASLAIEKPIEVKGIELKKGSTHIQAAVKRTQPEILHLAKIEPVIDPALYSRSSFTVYHPFKLDLFQQPSGFYLTLYPQANPFTIIPGQGQEQPEEYAFAGKITGRAHSQKENNLSECLPDYGLTFIASPALKPKENLSFIF